MKLKEVTHHNHSLLTLLTPESSHWCKQHFEEFSFICFEIYELSHCTPSWKLTKLINYFFNDSYIYIAMQFFISMKELHVEFCCATLRCVMIIINPES